jgi:hypothetical protein
MTDDDQHRAHRLDTAEAEAAREAAETARLSGSASTAAIRTAASQGGPRRGGSSGGSARSRSGGEAVTVSREPSANVYQGGAELVEADTVTIRRGGAGRVNAERLEITQGGVGRAEAGEIHVEQGGVGLARAQRVEVRMGGVGAAIGEEIELNQAFARLAVSTGSVKMEQAGAMTVVANDVSFGPQSGVVFLIARRVQGDVRTLFDWRAAAAFGAAVGLVLALIGPRRRR